MYDDRATQYNVCIFNQNMYVIVITHKYHSLCTANNFLFLISN
jgi:hypothetical protein